MAFADVRIRSLEIANDCVRLGARQRTIAWITGLPPSFIARRVYDEQHRAPRGRPPYAEDYVFRSSLKVQAEAGVFAAKYRLLTAGGVVPATALITAFRHYLTVVKSPSISFDEAFFLASNLDGTWAAPTRTLELGACRRCGCMHILPRGAAPAGRCPFCACRSKEGGQPAPGSHCSSSAPGPALAPVAVPAKLEARIHTLRVARSFERLGAHPRIVATLLKGPVAARRRAQPQSRTPAARVGRPINLVRWGVAVKTLHRAQFSLVAAAYGRLITSGFEPADALRATFKHVVSLLPEAPPMPFDRCFELVSLLDPQWGLGKAALHLKACPRCRARYLVSRTDRTPAHCPFCALIRSPGKYL